MLVFTAEQGLLVAEEFFCNVPDGAAYRIVLADGQVLEGMIGGAHD